VPVDLYRRAVAWGDNESWAGGNSWVHTRHAIHQPRADTQSSAATQEVPPPGTTGCAFGLGTPQNGGGYYDYWGSAHPGGFNVALADASVRVIRYNVDLANVLRPLSDRGDGKAFDSSGF